MKIQDILKNWDINSDPLKDRISTEIGLIINTYLRDRRVAKLTRSLH